ncbi:putative 30 kDa heat shock protein [Bisporella sp. PMI_857]|nr:putative 30 kDa heat shock protein [Bisporella sp. PMI_857]
MSLFPRTFISEPTSSFSPLFQFLDDFDKHQGSKFDKHHRNGVLKSFNPKFDVTEHGDVYELHGEFPGIDQKDIEIEFSDNQTLHIKGRTERSYTSGTPPTGQIENGKPAGAITEGEQRTPHKPTTEKRADAPKHWISERSIGEFSRSFTFPVRVDQDAVTASMKNGILSIVVPKSKKAEGRKITIS